MWCNRFKNYQGGETLIPDSNALASQNGYNIESQICAYLGIEHNCNAIVDAVLDGHPLEIKSCQEYIGDSSHNNGRRSGRFQLNEEQHQYLVENDGIYAFVVHCEGEIKRTCIKKASSIGEIVGRSCGRTWSGVMSG
jgi:hypothetical protein